MAVTRTALSPLGKYLAPQIKVFMMMNATAAAQSSSIDDGVGAISEAIAYGIAKALGSPIFIASLTAGVGLTAGPLQVASLTPNVAADQV